MPHCIYTIREYKISVSTLREQSIKILKREEREDCKKIVSKKLIRKPFIKILKN